MATTAGEDDDGENQPVFTYYELTDRAPGEDYLHPADAAAFHNPTEDRVQRSLKVYADGRVEGYSPESGHYTGTVDDPLLDRVHEAVQAAPGYNSASSVGSIEGPPGWDEQEVFLLNPGGERVTHVDSGNRAFTSADIPEDYPEDLQALVDSITAAFEQPRRN